MKMFLPSLFLSLIGMFANADVTCRATCSEKKWKVLVAASPHSSDASKVFKDYCESIGGVYRTASYYCPQGDSLCLEKTTFSAEVEVSSGNYSDATKKAYMACAHELRAQAVGSECSPYIHSSASDQTNSQSCR